MQPKAETPDSVHLAALSQQRATVSTAFIADALGLDESYVDQALTAKSLGEIATYVQALKDHDWQFEYTDDHRVWIRGTNSLAKITRLQKLVDADCVLWNAHCPEAYRKEVPA